MKKYTWVFALLLLFACSNNDSLTTPAPPQPPATQAVDNSELQDAEQLAESLGISAEEAFSRLAIQNNAEIDALSDALTANEADTFAGLWLQQEPNFAVIVAFTRDGEETIQKYVQPNTMLADLVQTVPASYTYAQLLADQNAIDRTLREANYAASTGVMLMDNAVEVTVTDEAGFEEALSAIGATVPESVRVVASYVPVGDEPSFAISAVDDVTMVQLVRRDAAFMEALLSGTLAVVDGCLRIMSDFDAVGHLVVWQADYFLSRSDDGAMVVLNESGEQVATVGDEIYLGGGEMSAPDSAELNAPIPANCSGPYWRMGEFLPEEFIDNVRNDAPAPVQPEATALPDGAEALPAEKLTSSIWRLYGGEPLGFKYPTNWRAFTDEVAPNWIAVSDGEYRLDLRARRLGDDAIILPFDDIEGELVAISDSTPIIGSLDQALIQRELMHEEKLKRVIYTNTADNLVISTGTWELTAILSGSAEYSELDIPEQIVAQSAEIIGSLWVSAPESAEIVPSDSFTEASWLSNDQPLTNDVYEARYAFAARGASDLFPDGSREHVLLAGEVGADDVWKVIHTQRSTAFGVTDYHPIAWANNLMYVSNRPIPEGGCDAIMYPSDLWQVQMQSGEVRRLLPAVGLRGFSPATRRAAGLTADGFRIYDLNSRELMTFSADSLNPNAVTTMHFNADGSKLLILSADFYCGESTYYVQVYDFVLGELITYPNTFTSEPLTVESWERNVIVLLATNGQQFEIDLLNP